MPEIVALARDPARRDGGVLCQLDDGRVFVTLEAEVARYAEASDETALPAFNRAWEHRPQLFAGPVKPRMPVIAPSEGPGIAADLTAEDRARLYRIIRKHRAVYFAPGEEPTERQMDNLIDCLGARAAEKIVKAQVDAGRLN